MLVFIEVKWVKNNARWFLTIFVINNAREVPIFNINNARLACLQSRVNFERALKMTVFNSKPSTLCEVTITPSSPWRGQGLLGVSIRFVSFSGVRENDIELGSPAEKVGLQSYIDYVIGVDSLVPESEHLFTLIDQNARKPLKLFVYNYTTDVVRWLASTICAVARARNGSSSVTANENINSLKQGEQK